MAIGAGLQFANLTSDHSEDYGGSVDGSFSGGGLALEFALGGTPAPGLVIGGGLYINGGTPRTQDITVNGRTVYPPEQVVALSLLGPFVDYYIDPKAGWHVQGAIGLANVAIMRRDASEGDPRVKQRGQGGFGFMVGGGYDLWVSSQWSLGGVVRLLYGTAETDNSETDHFRYEAFAVPELLFTVTYH